MAAHIDIKPIENFEITPETLEFTAGADTRNIGIKHNLCLRRSLPKTRLRQAILYENVSYARQLRMKMNTIKTDRTRNIAVLDSNVRAFVAGQKKKQQKWKRLDEVRLSNMNLPCVNLASESERPKSCKIMYRMNEFKPDVGEKQEQHSSPMLPKMNLTVHREQTEIITHRDKTFMTRFPELIEIDPNLIEKHNRYCGKTLLEGGSSRDNRFHKFIGALSPAIVDEEDYPVEFTMSKSRLSKYAPRDERSSPRPYKAKPKSHQQHLKDDVAKRFQAIIERENSSISESLYDDSDAASSIYLRYGIQPRKSSRYQKRGDYLLETYKSDDIIQLQKGRKLQQSIPEETEHPLSP